VGVARVPLGRSCAAPWTDVGLSMDRRRTASPSTRWPGPSAHRTASRNQGEPSREAPTLDVASGIDTSPSPRVVEHGPRAPSREVRSVW
jgi:hypothetical protein